VNQDDECSLEKAVKEQLLRLHGPMISGDALRSALGYPTMEAFRQALSRKTVPIPVFSIELRRGKFALVQDLAHWLALQRNSCKGAPME
jgi:hypothetical protein